MKEEELRNEIINANLTFGYKKSFKSKSAKEAKELFKKAVKIQNGLSNEIKWVTPISKSAYDGSLLNRFHIDQYGMWEVPKKPSKP